MTTTDALGRLRTVQEYTWSYPNATLLNTTLYYYNVADKLTSITDQAGNPTTIVYDTLGRKTDFTDRDLGHWQYHYPDTAPGTLNPLWLVQTQTDAANNPLSYQYDGLDRLTQKSAPNLTTMQYHYDTGTGTNLFGRRASMTDAAGTVTYSYDQRGRLTTLVRPINGTNYQFTTTYDAQDRVLSLTYPNQDVLSYQYGDHGLPVAAFLNGTALVQGASYNALLKLGTLPLGNGLLTTWQYYGIDKQFSTGNPNKWFGLPYQLQTTNVQTQTFPNSGNLGYDNVGDPTGISYGDHTSEGLTFGYNELNQLLSMAGGGGDSYGSYIQSGNYDIGNLLSVGGHSLGYAVPAPPHTPLGASGLTTYTFDTNGNRVNDQTSSYAYDGENHLTALIQGSTPLLQNTFDGDGQRVVRVVNSTTKTHYVGGWYEANPDTGSTTAYYPFNGVPIALKQGSTLSYLHHDHLGSLVSLTDASGNEQWWGRYAPFGTLRLTGGLVPTSQLPTDRLFTGQTRDLTSDGFYFFKARYYDATIGKFQAPDTVVPRAGNPQTLNRYAYGLNHPLRIVDPSGHFSEDQLKAWGYT